MPPASPSISPFSRPARARETALPRPLPRSLLAARRAEAAQRSLAHCQLCAHRCGANRLQGETGPCRAGATSRVFHSQTEVADERELIPVFAVSFSGCDLRCDFCITGRQSWDPSVGDLVSGPDGSSDALHDLAARARQALADGACSVMLLGGEPTIHLPTALRFASLLPDDATLIWKTNAHATEDARALLDDVFDVWVADYKFGNDLCATRLAHVPNYLATVRGNLQWAHDHTRLIVRHLQMPGHLECCWRPAAEWMAAELPGVRVSLREGFWPGWFSSRHPELATTVSLNEAQRARVMAEELGLNLIS